MKILTVCTIACCALPAAAYFVRPTSESSPMAIGEEAEREPTRFTLPPPEAQKTDAEFLSKVALPFYREHLKFVDVFDAKSATNAARRAEFMRLHEKLAAYYASGRRPGILDPWTRQRATDLYWREKSRDPAVCLVHALTPYDADFRWYQKGNVLREGLKACGPGVDPLWRMLLNLEGHACGWKPEHTKPFADGLVKAFTGEGASFTNADSRLLVRLLVMDYNQAFRRNFSRALPGVFAGSYVGHCLGAVQAMDDAFESRGTGWSRDVTDEGWKGWEERNAFAAAELKAAISEHPEIPEGHLILASLEARSCGSGDAVAELNTALAESIDAMPFAKGAIHFFTSRWGGSKGLLRQIIQDSMRNGRPGTMTPLYGASIGLMDLGTYEYDGVRRDLVAGKVYTPETCAAFCKMVDASLAATNVLCRPTTNLYVCAALTVAAYARDWDAFAAYKARLSPHEALDWWFLHETWMGQVSDAYDPLIRALAGEDKKDAPFAPKLLEAERAIDAGNPVPALEIYREILKGRRFDPKSAVNDVVSRRAFDLGVEEGIRKGGWVDVMPSSLGGEAAQHYSSTLTGRDGIAVSRENRQSHYFAHKPLPARNVAYRATIHFLPPKKPGTQEIIWELMHSNCVDSDHGAPQVRFLRDKEGDHCQVRTINVKTKGGYLAFVDVKLARADKHDFVLTRVGGRIKVQIDGKDEFDMAERDFYRDSWTNDPELYLEPDRGQPLWRLNDQGSGTGFSNYAFKMLPPEPEIPVDGPARVGRPANKGGDQKVDVEEDDDDLE